MATTALLVPGTARADVTDASLSVEFDNLSTDRIATITLKAKSTSGITDVETTVIGWTGDVRGAIGTLPLNLVEGNANDGTWRAEYQTDIQQHPGDTGFRVQIKSADGTALSRTAKLDNCYETFMTDTSVAPDVVDYDRPNVEVRGRVMMQKTRESPLEPVPGVTVEGGDPDVQTDAAGNFALNAEIRVSYTSVLARVTGQRPFCYVGEYVGPEISKQTTEISVHPIAVQPVKVGDKVTIRGTIMRHGAAGLVPATGAPAGAYVNYGTPEQYGSPIAYAAEDGTFNLEFTAEVSGPVTVLSKGNVFLEGGQAAGGHLQVRKVAEIIDYAAPPKAQRYADLLTVSGTLTDGGQPFYNQVYDALVILEFSENGKSWRQVVSDRTSRSGYFLLNTRDTKKDGYWRARFVGNDQLTQAVSSTDYVDVRYGTQMYDFSASPKSLVKGGTVTVKGSLWRFPDEPGPAPNRTIYIYFMPLGSSEWTQMAVAKTGTNGWFQKTFRAVQDGYWTAGFWGDDAHLATDAPIGFVDVKGVANTGITDFGASPASVEKGGTTTVEGLLRRFTDAGGTTSASGLPVYIYFLPAGSSEWKQVAVARTGADGRFKKAFTAEQDGYWTAWYWGDGQHLRSNSATKYVDVR
ncbi:hypothetical protein [Actinomadura algeriensis]|uniref:Carboxypeptidase regulatory-like domain-containing protein n=1 Tax=Actinomadura algeriensis TaxID=1679523 RepID=A0ABR9JPW1_9ACTN|nr:hypothetical protein [Actinomadura algeriensis]MBE1532528.1 hypothetical protein [Actinomadura algeriensis]